MEAMLSILMLPIFILNLLGGIVSGIWLIVLGKWGMFLHGILIALFGSYLITLLSLPAMFLLMMPTAYFYEKKQMALGTIFGFLNLIYTIALITFWCLTIMLYFINSSNERSLMPAIIWSYGVALGPWMYMASKENQGEGRNEFSALTVLWTQISYIIAMIMFFSGALFPTIVRTFMVCMLLLIVLEGVIFLLMAKNDPVFLKKNKKISASKKLTEQEH